MSRIYFHSPNGDAEVSGCERGLMAARIHRIFRASLDWESYTSGHHITEDHPLRSIVPEDHYSMKDHGSYWARVFGTAMSVSSHEIILDIDGKQASMWEIELNTAVGSCSDPMILCARLHAQCEIHTWVSGRNRHWLAKIIEDGLNRVIFRRGFHSFDPISKKVEYRDMGWESAIKLLKSDKHDPVVTSYSVCEQFPNAGVAAERGTWVVPLDAAGNKDWDKWYDLPDAQQWELAFKAVKSQKWLEMKPDNWRDYHFGDSDMNGWQLMEWLADRPAKSDRSAV